MHDTVHCQVLNSNKHKHTLTALTGLAFLAGPTLDREL